MKSLVFLVNTLCLQFCVSIFNPNDELQMIVDVVKAYDKPTAVVAKLCWKSRKYDTIYKTNIQIRIMYLIFLQLPLMLNWQKCYISNLLIINQIIFVIYEKMNLLRIQIQITIYYF